MNNWNLERHTWYDSAKCYTYYAGETYDPDEDSFVKRKENKKGRVHKEEKNQIQHNLKNASCYIFSHNRNKSPQKKVTKDKLGIAA